MPSFCLVDNCNKPIYCKGFCKRHYSQFKKHGEVLHDPEPTPDLPGEIWKDIPGYEGLYQVSNFGRVKSLNYGRTGVHRILKTQKYPDRYIKVDLRHNGTMRTKHVHRLVAEAFIPNPKNKTDVNHIDGDKHNNAISNLEWCSRSENMKHCKEVLNKNAGRPPRPVKCLETGKIYVTLHQASSETGIPLGSIVNNLKDSSRFAGGFHWVDVANGN